MILLLIFAFGAVCHADKLDRTYLPPPGSKYAGGSPDAILPPIELPKSSSYSTNAPTPQGNESHISKPAGTYQQGIPQRGRLNQEDINQNVNYATQVPTRFGSSTNSDHINQVPTDYNNRLGVTNKPGFIRSQEPTTSIPPSVYRNSYPTTNTVYSFAQTTTYSPIEEQGCFGQNCVYTPSGPGLLDSTVEPQISISQHAPERIANQFGSTERPLQTYPQQFQYTSQASTDLFGQPGVQTQYSNQNAQSRPTTILPQHNLDNNYDSSLNTPQPNFPSQQETTTSQKHGIGYEPTVPSQSIDNFQTHGDYSPYSTNDNQQVNPSFTSSDQPEHSIQADRLSGNRAQNRFDSTHPLATLPKSDTAGFRPSNSLDSRLADAVYGSSTPFPVTSIPSSPTFETGLSGNNNGIEAQSKGQIATFPLNNHTGIPPSHRVNDEFDRNAYIVNYEYVITPEGFAYSYDTSNGIHANENGTAYDGVKAQGSYSYTGDDGKVYTIVYTADENGFQPKGDHLPTPPPIPEAILRVIEEANRSKAAGIVDDGMYDEEKYGYQKYEGAMERFKSRHMNQPKISKQRIEIDDKNIPSYDKNVSVENYDEIQTAQGTKPNKVNEFTRRKMPMKETSDRHGQMSQDQRYINENKPKSYSTGKGKFDGSLDDNNDGIKSNLLLDIDNVGPGQESYDFDSNPIDGSIGNIQHKNVAQNNVPRGSGRRPVNPVTISKTQSKQKSHDNGNSIFDHQHAQKGINDQFTTGHPIVPGTLPIDNFSRGSGRRPVHPAEFLKPQKTYDDDSDSNTFDSQIIRKGNQPMSPDYVSTDKSFVRGQTRRPTAVSSRLPTITRQKLQEDYDERVPGNVNFEESNNGFSDVNDHDTNQNIPSNGGQLNYEFTRMEKYSDTHNPKPANNYEFDSSVQASTRKPSIRTQDYDEKSNGYKYLPPSNTFDQLSSTALPAEAAVTTSNEFVSKIDSTRRPFTTPGVTRTEVENEDDLEYNTYVTSTTKKPYYKYKNQNNFVPQKQIEEDNIAENEKQLMSIGVNFNKPYNTDYENRKPMYNLRANDPEQNAVSSTAKPVYYPSSTLSHSTVQPSTKRVNYYPREGSNQITRGPEYQPSTTYRPQDFSYTSQDHNSHSFAPNYIQSTETPFRQVDSSVRPGSPTNNRISQSTPYPQYGTTESGNVSKFPDHHSTISGNYIQSTETPFRQVDNSVRPFAPTNNRISQSTPYPQYGTTQSGNVSEFPDRHSTISGNYIQSSETPFRQVDNSVRPFAPTNNRISQSTPYPQYGTTQSGNVSKFPDRHSTISGNKKDNTVLYDSQRGPQHSTAIQFEPQGNSRQPQVFDNRSNVEGTKSATRSQFGTTQTPEFGSRITKPYQVPSDSTPPSKVTPNVHYISPSTPGFTTQRSNLENKNVYLPSLPSKAYDRPASTHNGVKGEDFSGPKQQPKFDPETGYHY